jgi:hypothetical protein
MASRNTAAAMLNAGRDRVTRSEPDGQQQQDQPTSAPTPPPSDQATKPPVAQYEKASIFFTPEQRQWIEDTAHALNLRGVGGSDLVRLAIVRLQADVESGFPLADELVEQVYRELERFPGRKNRGLPPRRARQST